MPVQSGCDHERKEAMKITPREILDTVIDQKTGKAAGTATGVNFGDILKETINGQTASASRVGALPPLDNISGMALNALQATGKGEAVKRVSDLLGLLEEYQSQMEDPAVTLKQTAPLVSRMDEESRRLLPMMESLPEGDGLKDILNRLLVASTVEVIKFNRGDYVA